MKFEVELIRIVKERYFGEAKRLRGSQFCAEICSDMGQSLKRRLASRALPMIFGASTYIKDKFNVPNHIRASKVFLAEYIESSEP